MAGIRKFQFDVDFDAPPAAAPSADVAPPPPPPPSYGETELAAAKAEAFAAGRDAGRAEAARETERRSAAALGAIGAALESVAPMCRQAFDESRNAALSLAAAVATKLVPALLRGNAVAAVQAAVADILPRVIDEPRLVIRVEDSLVDPLREPIDALAARSGFAGRLILLGDARVEGADCRIEWADGGAEHDIARLTREIEATVDRFLRGVGDGSPAADDDTLNHDMQEAAHG